ncbi:MAG: RHS repeat-associated core domain-containing protein [Acidobacteria bacterium]|nr:RHS repeat-associated core domain-containing protein [Acidobacteriota bacterium]
MSHEMVYTFNAPSTIEPMFTAMTETWDGINQNTGAPGISGTPLTATTTYQVTEETGRRSTRIVRPDNTINVQWQIVAPGQYNDGLFLLEKTCASLPCGYNDSALRNSSVDWEYQSAQTPQNYLSPRVKRTLVQPRPYDGTYQQATNLVIQTWFEYGSYNRPIRIQEYGFSGATIRSTEITYDPNGYYDAAYRHILRLPKIVEVKDHSSTPAVVKQKTEYVYDTNAMLSNTLSVIQHDPAYDPQDINNWNYMTDFRGLVTQIKRYPTPSSSAGMVTETRTYDETGNLLTAATSCCEQTSFTYSNNTCFAYPETQKRGSANDPNAQVTTSAIYNVNTGLATQTTDANGRVSTTSYCTTGTNCTPTAGYTPPAGVPGSLRVRQQTSPTGARVEYCYDDTALQIKETAYLTGTTVGSQNLKTLDGAGRVTREIAYGAAMVQDIVDTRYDGLGRVWRQTRPYRTGENLSWFQNTYDPFDRISAVSRYKETSGQNPVITFEETLTETFYDETAQPTVADANGKGNTIRNRDAWGRERWVRFDWAGRLCEVVEPSATGSGALTTTGPLNDTLTKYGYDCLNNLTQVDQCVVSGVGEQTRKFQYDGLSRLTHQKLAEREKTLASDGTYSVASGIWSDFFQYDTRSNLINSTDARGVKTTFNYNNDPLNRLQSVSYDKLNVPTANRPNIIDAASVTYEYMATGDCTRLRKVTDGVGTDEFTYDNEGRLNQTNRAFTGRTSSPLTVNYQFDALDRLQQMTYPLRYGTGDAAGKVEAMTFDETSRVNNLTYDNRTYASAVSFNAASQTTALAVGNAQTVPGIGTGTPWNETYTYEEGTGLLSGQKVQATNSSTPALDLSYSYLRQTGAGRTGQLTKIVNNKDNSRNKYYEYDALSRLKTVYSYTGTASTNPMTSYQWMQNYGFDKFGNRTTVSKTGTIAYTDGLALLSFTDAQNKVSTNRITTAGYTYDEAGNLTCGQSEGGTWQKYKYDTAGRLVETWTNDTPAVQLASYSYGASNHRLKQTEFTNNVGTTCYYAWDGNSIIGEFNEITNGLAWMKSYLFLGGRLLATHVPGNGTNGIVNLHHPDRLGTRLVTNETGGSVAAEQVTLPYGTALDGESYMTPTNRRFTSYDRSSKTKLDYAVNRFYSSCQGRFTQVDPIGMAAVSLSDPQSLNLYAYVGGDPINRIDPEGLFWGAVGRFFKALGIAIAIAFGFMAAGQGGNVNFRTPGFNGNAGLPGLSGGGGSGSNPFRTPGFNGNAGVSGVNSFLAGRGENLANLRGFFSPADGEFLAKVFEALQQRIKNPACAKLLGGAENAQKILNRSRPFYANTVNPNYKGTDGKYYDPKTGKPTAVTTAIKEANDPNSTVAAVSERGAPKAGVIGRNVYLNHRFFLQGLANAATIYVHELRHNNGLGSEIDTDYESEYRKISIHCGTGNPYDK